MHLPKTMRALVCRGADDLRVETVPLPEIGPGELLVRVHACGVCPSDLKKIDIGFDGPPRIFGHETSGVIAKTSGDAHGFVPGDRVALHHHVPCLNCRFCDRRQFAQCLQYKRTGVTAGFEPAGGGFAEYVRVMPFVLPGVMKVPLENSFAEAAMLEPVNTVLKAVQRLRLAAADRVWVAGQGPIGLMFTRLLALSGVQVFASDLLDERLGVAVRLGAAQTWSGELGETGAPDWRELDAAVVTVPADAAVRAGFARVRPGGQILVFGHTVRGRESALDFSRVCVEEKTLLGSYSADFSLQNEVAELVFSRKMDVRPLLTHFFPLDQALEAISLVRRPREGSLKVIVGVEIG